MARKETLQPEMRADQLAPHEPEIEAALLQLALRDPRSIEDVRWLRPDDFFIVRHAWVWEAALDLGPVTDLLSVAQHLEARGRLAEIGGAAYLMALLAQYNPGSAEHHVPYARAVQEMAIRRRLIDAAGMVARVAHEKDTPLADVLARSESAVREAIDEGGDPELEDDRDAWASAEWDRMAEWARNPGQLRGFGCGFLPIDRTLNGFQAGHLHWIAGRPGMGKSALMCQMATGFAREGTPTLYFALEMDAEETRRWMAAQLARVSSTGVVAGTLNAHELERYQNALDALRKLPLYVVRPKGGMSIPLLRAIARRYRRRHGVKVVMVDTLNNLDEFGSANKNSAGSNLHAQVTTISKTFQAWALDDQVALFAAVQMNRAATQRADHRPTLSDLRESGSLEQAAHVVLAVHRDSYYDESADSSVAQIGYLKVRMGPGAGRWDKVLWMEEWPGFSIGQEKTVALGSLSAGRTNGKALHAHNVPEEDDLL